MKKPLFNIISLLFIGTALHAQIQSKQKPIIPQVKQTVAGAKPVEPTLKTVPAVANGLINLHWEKPHTETIGDNGPEKVFFGFKGAIYDQGKAGLPEYIKRIKLSSTTNHISVNLVSTTYTPLTSDELSALNKNKLITTQVNVHSTVIHDRKSPYAQVIFIPIRKNPSTGQYEKLVSFNIAIDQTHEYAGSKKSLHKAVSFATSSVLASGTWHKLGVTTDGVYKLDYNFFKNLGYDMSTLVPANIRVYGNGGAMLNIVNGIPQSDDLAENAIFVQGQTDATFQPSDYVLFYGQSPHVWNYDSADGRYHHTVNLYTDTTYYFVTADLGSGRRITAEKDSAYTVTDTVKAFDDYQYNELDQTNLIQSGNQWFGQYFDVSTSYNIAFTYPNIVSGSQVYINTALASRYDQSNGAYSTYTSSCNDSSVTLNPATVSTGCYFCVYAAMATGSFTYFANSPSFTVNVNKVTPGAIGWLYFVETNVRRPMTMINDQMEFRDASTVKAGNISLYNISTSSPLQVWDVSHPQSVASLPLKTSAGKYSFMLHSDSLKQLIAFTGNTYLTPTNAGLVPNQNLHAWPQVDMVIVANPNFLTQANDLAIFHHTHDGLNVQVATTTQVYNEFSSGRQDPMAIRDFCRMFYQRETSYGNSLKYLLLYGDGSYDPKYRIAGNTNFVITYESNNSFDPTQSYVTDDFYAVLDSGYGDLDANNYNLDIGVGRLTVDNVSEAQTVLNKIESYESPSGEPIVSPVSCCNPQTQYNLGNWKNVVCFIAHDGDGDEHITEAEDLADTVSRRYKNFNINKIYLDAYQMQQTPGGPRYPEVNTAIDQQMDNGLLIFNYTGHGGQLGLATTRVLTFSDIYSWTNINKLSLFFTASCEFARFDDPEQISAGQLCLESSSGGNIALFSTVRDVYSGENYQLNLNFWDTIYYRLPDNSMPRLGDLFRESKNMTGPIVNCENFALLGDPAVTLAYPKNRVYTTAVTCTPLDTLKALSKVTVTGYVGDTNMNILSGFNGLLYPTIYDKPVYEFTLDNLGGTNSPVLEFALQKNELFNGKTVVTNGKFSFTFVVPKDIQYNYGNGKISYYAQNGSLDATGNDQAIVVGGSSSTAVNNGKGPQVRLYMNDSNFAYGGMTNENPEIYALLSDSNGINTTGSAIGHDITAVLDNNTANTMDLNDYYQPALNSYQKGTVICPLSGLSSGKHTLALRVWNVYNNTSLSSTEFNVEPQASLQLQHVLNYPNPFTTDTKFFFEINEVCDQMDVQIQIFTVAGKLVKNILTTVKTDSFRSQPIDWNGRDDFGDKIGNGVYIYHVKVRTSDGSTAESYQKLVIL